MDVIILNPQEHKAPATKISAHGWCKSYLKVKLQKSSEVVMPSSLSLGVGNHCSENVCPDSSFSSLSIYQCVNFHWEWLKWLPNFQTHPYSGGFIHFILWDISLYPSISHPSAGYVRPHIWKAEQRRGGGGLPERLFVTDGWCRILRILKTCWNVCVSFMYIYIILYIYIYIYIRVYIYITYYIYM